METNLHNLVSRVSNRLYARFIVPLREKTYRAEDGEKIHYLYYPPKRKDKKVLIVVLQALHKDGPRYNYLATLSGVRAGRLYIKDDFFGKSGDYYLGRNGKFNIEADVRSLIDSALKWSGAEKLIFAGSSKGGYSAINFAMDYPGSAFIAGGAQYRLGSYMPITGAFRDAVGDIVGEPVTQEKLDALDRRLEGKIREHGHEGHNGYVHYSVNDGAYIQHGKELVEDMEEAGICLSMDMKDYEGHSQMRFFFPEYLRKTADMLCGQEKKHDKT